MQAYLIGPVLKEQAVIASVSGDAGKTARRYDQTLIDIIGSARPTAPPMKFSQGLDISLWIRMLYSSLVDADFLIQSYI